MYRQIFSLGGLLLLSACSCNHDVEHLSNGNILFPVWERVAAADALEMGFSVNQDNYPDAIIVFQQRYLCNGTAAQVQNERSSRL